MQKIVIGVIVLAILIGGYAVVSSSKLTSPTPTMTNSPVRSITPSQNDLLQGGNSYLDEKGVFSLLYPNDWSLDTSDPVHVRIYKRTVTARPQGEISDGALIVFETVELKGTTLEAFVDSRIKASTADGSSKIAEAKTPITLNNYHGFSYSLDGVGSSQNLVLQKDSNSSMALLITYAINDPENKGYQQEVNDTLSTLQLLK